MIAISGTVETGEAAFDRGSQAGACGLGGGVCLFGARCLDRFGPGGDCDGEPAAEERPWRFVSSYVVGESRHEIYRMDRERDREGFLMDGAGMRNSRMIGRQAEITPTLASTAVHMKTVPRL